MSRIARQTFTAAALAGALFGSPGRAQLDATCVVSALNRSAPVEEDGSWLLPNVPANQGRVRVRATCVDGDEVRSGQSLLVTVPADGVVRVPAIDFADFRPIPATLALAAPVDTLTEVGETVQITATASYPDGATGDVTAGSLGTSYRSSNAAIASVDPDGRVTAHASGRVLISAVQEGALGILDLAVVVSGDSDGDGIADDLELSNGLDPNDPIDALLDLDGDGLTNFDELVRFGTDPRLADSDSDGLADGEEVVPGADGFLTDPRNADSDGDGVRDGLEVETGTDPTDPASFNLGAALSALEFRPPSFAIVANTLLGEASRQLAVIGRLRDGSEIDLTAAGRGTSYLSSDLAVCSFGSQDGRVFAGADGACTITARNAGYAATSVGLVRRFSPVALAALPLPGSLTNLDIVGDLAYVSSLFDGLHVVGLTDRNNPQLLTSVTLPGSLEDVRVSGNVAYVAAGEAGLITVDLSDPANPVELAVVPAVGYARDLAVRGDRALVVGQNGLEIFDVSDPAAPLRLGGLNSFGDAGGVDLSADGLVAAVTASGGGGADVGGGAATLAGHDAGGGPGLYLVDVSDPAAPAVLGSVSRFSLTDVVLRGRYAYLAGIDDGLTTVDVSDPANPLVLASTDPNLGGRLSDVALFGDFSFGADIFFVNGVPIVDVSNPGAPLPRAILDFSQLGDDNGTGIEVDDRYVYMTGSSWLFVGQYLQIEDSAGIPPTVRIASPAEGDSAIEGSFLDVAVDAEDDIGVAAVEIFLDGQTVAVNNAPPFTSRILLPSDAPEATLGARAVDFGGNEAHAQEVTIQLLPDPGTTVVGRVADPADAPVAGAAVSAFGRSGTTAAEGEFAIPDVSTVRGAIRVTATGTVTGESITETSSEAEPVPGGITDVGTIVLQPSACASGALTFDPFQSTSRVVFLCRQGPVDFPLNLFRQTDGGGGAELQESTLLAGQAEELVGQITPGTDGRFCADLRPNVVYYLRREDVLCDDGVVRSCSASIQRFRSDVDDRCADSSPACEDLGTVVFDCDFFGGS